MGQHDDATDADSAALRDAAFDALLDKLRVSYNADFRESKEPSLARRIRARMAQVRVEAFDGYARYLDQHPDEHVALVNAILDHLTGFFRDPEGWRSLAANVLPRLVADAQESRSMRLWSVGCSSGEETYSLAMLLADQLGDTAGEYTVKIYGTDIDEAALSTARHAAYRLDDLKDVPPELVERHFTREGQLYRLRLDLRRWCIFGIHDVVQAPPLSHIDLLVCRNVLLYFTAELQERILSRFHYAIREGGYLFLGRAESLLARSRLFMPLQPRWRLFQRIPTADREAAAVLPERAAPAPTPGGEHHGGAEPLAATRAFRALEALPMAMLIVDVDDTVLAWNAASEELLDIPPAAAVGRKFRDLDVSDRVEGLRAHIEEVKSRHVRAQLDDVTFTRRDGELVHAEITINPLLEGPRLIGVLVTATNATKQARLHEQMVHVVEEHTTAIEELQSTNEELETTNEELQSTNEELEATNEELQSTNEELESTVEELQAANTQLARLNAELETRNTDITRLDTRHRSLVNSLDHGVIVLDRDLVVTTWNQAAERMWGRRAEQAVGRALPAVLNDGAGPDAERTVQPALDRVLRTGQKEAVDVMYTVPGGGHRPASFHLSPLRDMSGDIIGVVGLVIPADATGAAPRPRR